MCQVNIVLVFLLMIFLSSWQPGRCIGTLLGRRLLRSSLLLVFVFGFDGGVVDFLLFVVGLGGFVVCWFCFVGLGFGAG